MTDEELLIETAKIETKARMHEWLNGPEAIKSKLFYQLITTGKMPDDAAEQIQQSGKSCAEEWNKATAEVERLMAENGIEQENEPTGRQN